MTDYMIASLKKFLNEESVSRIENSGARIWKETYKEAKQRVKPFINVVFCRYQADNTSETDMGTAGYVLAIPSYWIDVTTDLAIIYISSFVDTYLKENFNYGVTNSSSAGSSCNPSTSTGKKPCPVHPTENPAPKPPAIPPREKDNTPPPRKPNKKPHKDMPPPPPIFNPPPPEDVARPIQPGGDFTYMSSLPHELEMDS